MLSANLGRVRYDGSTESTVNDGQFYAADFVTSQLVPSQDPLGIRPHLSVYRDAKDDMVIVEIVGFGSLYMSG